MIYYNFSSDIDYVNNFDIKKNGIQLKESETEIEIRVDVFRSTPVFLFLEAKNKVHVFDNLSYFYLNKTFKKKIDVVGFWEIILFETSLWTRTLYKNFYQLPSASILIINKTNYEFKIERYWDFNVKVDPEIRDINIAAEKINSKLENIAKNLDKNDNYVMGLSGGLDSRISLAYITKFIDKEKIKLFTYGYSKKSLEYNISKKICKVLNLMVPEFHALTYWSYKKALKYLPLKSVGQIGINHCHIIDYFNDNPIGGRTYISNYFSDAIFGYECNSNLTANEKYYNPYIDKIESAHFLDDKIKTEILNDSIKVTEKFNPKSNLSSLKEYIYITERNPKFHNLLFNIQKEYSVKNIDFFNDYELLTLSLSIPIQFRNLKKIEYFILEKYFSKISSNQIGDISSDKFSNNKRKMNTFKDHLNFKLINRINAVLRILTKGTIQMENKFQTEELERILYQHFRKDLKNAVELFSNMGVIKDYQKSFFNSLPIRSDGVGLKYSLISLSTLFK